MYSKGHGRSTDRVKDALLKQQRKMISTIMTGEKHFWINM